MADTHEDFSNWFIGELPEDLPEEPFQFKTSPLSNFYFVQEEERRMRFLVSLMTEEDRMRFLSNYYGTSVTRGEVRELSEYDVFRALTYNISGVQRNRNNLHRLIREVMSEETLAAWRTVCRMAGRSFSGGGAKV